MLKKLLSSAILLALAISVNAQHNRRVLVEEFTNASCNPCAANNPAFNATLLENDTYVTPVKYQVWWPGVDPMYTQTAIDVNPRVAYYGVNGVPNGIENGSTDLGVPGGYTTEQIQAAWSNLTPVTIALSHSLTADFDSVLVTVSVTSDAAITGDLRLRVALIEKEIIFATAPGTNQEKEFSFVMRKMLPSADGTTTGDFAAGETKTYSFAYPMDNYYDLNQIGVAAWLQDDLTKEVWQSERTEPNTVVVGSNASITLTANASYKLICTNTLAPAFSLKNLGTAAITSANIRFKAGAGNWQSYTWSGSLNPNLTTAVSLPAVTFPASGYSTVDLQILGTSAGVQLNQNAGKGTIKVNAMYDDVLLPIGADFEDNQLPPAGFGLKNTSADAGWNVVELTGGFDLSTHSMYCDFYNMTSGTTVEFLMPRVNLTAVAGAKLTFDHAHCYYSATDKDDRLRVDVSTDCGATWATLYDKMGDGLATAPLQSSAFVPAADQWVSDLVDLTAYAGQDNVLIRLRGTSDYGNLLWVDNLAVTEATGTNEIVSLNDFAVQPNPASTVAQVHFGLDKSEDIQMMVYSVDGVLVQSQALGNLASGQHSFDINVSQFSAGNYRVVLQSKTGVAQKQLVVVK